MHPFLAACRAELFALDCLTYASLTEIARLLKTPTLHFKDDDPDGDWDDFSEPGEDFPDLQNRPISYPKNQLQGKYKHAMKYLGFPHYNVENRQKLGDLLRNFVNNP